MIEVLEEILKSQDEFDEVFWRMVVAAARHKDREILKDATSLDVLFDKIFWKIANIKNENRGEKR